MRSLLRTSHFNSALLWLLAFAPAIFVLAYILPLRLPAPYHDSWAYVEQYQKWVEGQYGWRELFAPHNNHPTAVGKLIYFAVLHAGGDMRQLTVVTWMLALAASLAVLGLSRPLWRGHPWSGPLLMFLANLSLFTLAQGHTWIWDFVFQLGIPSTCLVGALWALSQERVTAWRWSLAGLLATTAAFSFGTGPAVGLILVPAVWWAASNHAMGKRIAITSLWTAMALVVAWLALRFFVPAGVSVADAGGSGRLSDLLSRPWDTTLYVLTLLGHTLGQGTVVEPVVLCSLWGAVLLALFLGCGACALARKDATLRREAWPWLAIGLWAMINALAICFGRMRALLETALAPRYGSFMLLFVLAVLMLVAWTIFRAGEGKLARVLRTVAAPGVAVLVMFHLLAWKAGGDSLEVYYRRMKSEFVSLTFTNALPPQRDLQWQRDSSDGTANLVRFLKQQDLLPGIEFVEDAALSRWRMGEPSSERWANWTLVPLADGTFEMSGVCGLTRELVATPDLIVITAFMNEMPEKIVALAAPQIPDNFFDRALNRRVHYEHYFAWRWKVDSAALPAGNPVTLRAYFLDLEKRRVRRIKGEASVPPAPR